MVVTDSTLKKSTKRKKKQMKKKKKEKKKTKYICHFRITSQEKSRTFYKH